MKRIIVVAALLCASGSAMAAEVGLGVSVHSDDATIYVPIDVSESFRVEPMLKFGFQSREYETSPGTPSAGTTKTEAEFWVVGVGLFGVAQLSESASVYYGGRVGFMSQSYESSDSAGIYPLHEEYSDSFLIAPTIGVEYRFSEHFSIGGEAALTYENADNDGATRETTSTSTNIIFRYRF